MNLLLIAVIMIGMALTLIGIDLFVPTGGVLAILSAIAAFAAIGFGFAHSVTAGSWLTILVLAAVPIVLFLFIRIYPRTPIGQQMFIPRPKSKPFEYGNPEKSAMRSIVGRVGLAKTDLHPSGTIAIDETNFEAVSNSGLIEAGSAVRVVEVEMAVATVEFYFSNDLQSNDTVSATDAVSLTDESLPVVTPQTLLNTPIEDFNLGDLDGEDDDTPIATKGDQ